MSIFLLPTAPIRARPGTAGRGQLTFPKLVDLHDGTAVYDESIWRKRPDWTFETAPE